jgi:hypothetical protein
LSGRQKGRARSRIEPKRVCQPAYRLAVGKAARASLEIGDPSPTEACAISERLLRQSSCSPVVAEERSKLDPLVGLHPRLLPYPSE